MARTFSKDAEKLLSGVDQSTRDQILSQGSGNVLTSGEASQLLSAFRAQGNPYSAQNLNSIVTNPVAPPDYSDPLGYRARLEAELGVTDIRNKSLATIDQLRKFDQSSLANQNYLENQTLKMGVITGQQASQARLRAQERGTLVDEAQATQDLLLAKQQEVQDRYAIYEENRNMLTQLILNNPGAKIKYTDTPETASSKLEAYAKKAKKEAYKDSLKAMALQMGIKTKGKSTKSLEKAISKVNSKALKAAQQESELKLEGLRLDIANTKSIIANRGKGDGKEEKATFEDFLYTANSRQGADGKLDPIDYNNLKAKWVLQGGASRTFDQTFGGYVNQGRISDYHTETEQ